MAGEQPLEHTLGPIGSAPFVRGLALVEKHYTGWVSEFDLISFLLNRSETESPGVMDTLVQLFKRGPAAADAVNFSEMSPFYAIPLERGMDQVLRVLASKTHRLAVVDTADANRINGIITQVRALTVLPSDVDGAIACGSASSVVVFYQSRAGAREALQLFALVAHGILRHFGVAHV